jgi:uncharacterized protein YkwD
MIEARFTARSPAQPRAGRLKTRSNRPDHPNVRSLAGTRLPRRWFPLLTVGLLVTAGALTTPSQAQPTTAAPLAAPAAPSADAGLESQFVARINSLRAGKGLSQLSVSGELQGVARAWTDRMVANGQISHNPNLGGQVSGSWTKLGENVGVGYDVSGLMQAFINSPAHYANLVDPVWTHVGVGVTRAGDGRIYTTHNFMALGAPSAPPPPPPPAPAAASAPPAPAPPTTAPPPTTTTTAPPPPPEPEPTSERVTAVLDPLRSLEAG